MINSDLPETRRIDLVLVCGATGYVGGRLVERLLNAGYRVRCLARDPAKLSGMSFVSDVRCEIVSGDLSDQASIRSALKNVDASFYLVHSMISAGEEFGKKDLELANNFSQAVRESSCSRIIYLGGLGELGEDLSKHLKSRQEVEAVLRKSGAEVTVFRAAMIIGSGSASFEMLRYLTHRLPLMITPRWVSTLTQPIAIRDVLRYLVSCLRVPETTGKTIDIGGPDVLSHKQMFQIMARKLGLQKRWILPVPVLSPRLSSYWIGWVTPVTPKIARPLAEGLRNKTVCRNDDAQQLMPGPLFTVEQAVEAALGKIGSPETRWASAGEMPTDPDWSGGTVFLDERSTNVAASAETVAATFCNIGGEHGYWGVDWLWHLRGWMDQAVGGPGLRRGRRDAKTIRHGEALDFWRVTYVDAHTLRLRAEMKLPGTGELEFRVEPTGPDTCRLFQTARFQPLGLLGLSYWYAVVPAHAIVFGRMIHGIRRQAETAGASRAHK